MLKPLLPSDIRAIHDILAFMDESSRSVVRAHLQYLEELQKQRRARGEARPVTTPDLADIQQQSLKMALDITPLWLIPLEDLGFPHLAKRVAHEMFAEMMASQPTAEQKDAIDALLPHTRCPEILLPEGPPAIIARSIP